MARLAIALPTVVGPRFNPGSPTGKAGTGWSACTDAVADASKITPPVIAKDTRSGHDISIEVAIDAGVPIRSISSKLHDVTTSRAASDRAVVALEDKEAIPNKDFVLSWEVASDQLQSGYLAHRNGQSGYFTIMLVPPKRVTPETVAPTEDYFGAQRGSVNKELKDEIIETALSHHIMTQYTSFVAVEEKVITDGGKPKTVAVPVEMPEGVSYEGVFGDENSGRTANRLAAGATRGISLRCRGAYGGADYARASGGGAGGMFYGALAAKPAPSPVPIPASALPPPPAQGDSFSLDQSIRRGSVYSEDKVKKDQPAGPEPSSRQKLAASLIDLIRDGAGAKASGLDVTGGKVTVKIWLTDLCVRAIEKLKDAGLEIVIQHHTAKTVIGRVDIRKLEELAKLDFVKLIEPSKARK